MLTSAKSWRSTRWCVPWGSGERAAEMTKLMAVHRYTGPASIWCSYELVTEFLQCELVAELL